MKIHRVFSLVVLAWVFGLRFAAAQEPVAEGIRNWSAPPFWGPPAERSPAERARGSEGTLPLGQESIQAASASSFLPFNAVDPCRVFDTRSTTPIAGGTQRNFTIAGRCGIPVGAVAVSFNFTVVNNFGGGFLTVFPAGTARPTVSTLNWGPSTGTIANAAIVPLSGLGAITAFVGVTTSDLIGDVNGYYAGAGSGANNTFLGVNAGNFTMSGSGNTGIGVSALFGNTTGINNTAGGNGALQSNTTGLENTASGYGALFSNTMGRSNTASGAGALFSNTTGNFNTAIGLNAGGSLTTGDNNICIGNSGVAGESNTIRIGYPVQTRTFIDGIRGRTTGQANAIPVLIDAAGQLGTASSSARYKEEVENMGETSSGLLKLRPVSFRYKGQAGDRKQFGLIAEEVEEVFPELVVHNSAGEVETVLYHEMPAMLLNELQKQQRRIEQQEGEIAALQARLAALEAALRVPGERQ